MYSLPFPYELKNHPDIGYWIDGLCGYKFVGYYTTLEKCLKAYRKKKGKTCR